MSLLPVYRSQCTSTLVSTLVLSQSARGTPATLAVYGSILVAGDRRAISPDGGLGLWLLAAVRPSLADHSGIQKGSGFSTPALGTPRQHIHLGSAAAGQGDPAETASGAGACLRVLGILRLRAGHHQPFRGRFSS